MLRRNLLLLIVCSILCAGGTFTCKSGDDKPPPGKAAVDPMRTGASTTLYGAAMQ
jgi:hypothetical protein